jgi:hypothetical protein
LGRKQEAAIAALLTEETHERAAARAGISPPTLQRWLRLPAFQDAYRRARREVLERTVATLLAAGGEAVKTLKDALKANNWHARIRAAIAVLSLSAKGLETYDLAEQVEQLRAQVEELQHGGNGYAGETGAHDAGGPGPEGNGEPAPGGHAPQPDAGIGASRPDTGPLAGPPPVLPFAEEVSALFPPER